VSTASGLGRGSGDKLVQPESISARGGEQILQDPFADLQDEFDDRPKGQSGKSTSMTAAIAGVLVVALGLGGGALAIAAQHMEESSGKAEECNEDTRQEESQLDILSPGMRNDNLAEVLGGGQQVLPCRLQRVTQVDALDEELEQVVSREAEAAHEREYESAMDVAYDGLLEQVLAMETEPDRCC